MVDLEEEEKRLQKEINKIDKELKKLDIKLSNNKFLEKAPSHIVAEKRNEYAQCGAIKKKFTQELESVKLWRN